MLRKKMLRDIKHNLSQFITIFLMVFIGVLAYSGIESYMMGMQYTADKFYKENNFFRHIVKKRKRKSAKKRQISF